MSDQKSLYAVLGTHPYATPNEIHEAYRVAKAGRDLSTTDGYRDFRTKSDAYEILRNAGYRAGYDSKYLPSRAEAILDVVRLLIDVGLNRLERFDMDGELKNALEITFKRIAVDHAITRQEMEWINAELSRQHPIEKHEDADAVMAAMTIDDIVMAIYAIRQNRIDEEVARDARKTPAAGFRVEAKSPGAPPKQPMLYTEIAEAKKQRLVAIIKDILEHPKDPDVIARFLDEVERGDFKAEWIITLAKANQTPMRISNYKHEYRAVLGNIGAALYQNPALAFEPVLMENISRYVFDGLAYSTRTVEETQAFNLFGAVLTLNPDAFTYDEFERYCLRESTAQGDGGMLIKQVIEVINARHDLAPAAVKGLIHKLYHHPDGEDPKGIPYTYLLNELLQTGVITHELLNGLEAVNKRRDISVQEEEHIKLKVIIMDAHKRVAQRPAHVRHAVANASDICFVD